MKLLIVIHTFCPDFPRCYTSWKRQFREADGNEDLKDAQHLAEVMFVCVWKTAGQLQMLTPGIGNLTVVTNLRENRTDLQFTEAIVKD